MGRRHNPAANDGSIGRTGMRSQASRLQVGGEEATGVLIQQRPPNSNELHNSWAGQ